MEDQSIVRLMETRRKAVEERARLDEDISAIDRVLKLLGVKLDELQRSEAGINEALQALPATQDDDSSSTRRLEGPSSKNGHSQKIRITQEVRNAVQEAEGEFNTQDVMRWIKEKYPDAEVRSATVSSTVWRMANEWGTIEKVRDGYGSEPNTYRKVLRDDSAQESFPSEERTPDEENTVSEEAVMSE